MGTFALQVLYCVSVYSLPIIRPLAIVDKSFHRVRKWIVAISDQRLSRTKRERAYRICRLYALKIPKHTHAPWVMSFYVTLWL